MTRVLGISGSLRRDSHNTRLLRAAGELLPPGTELELWDGLKAVPPFDEDDEAAPGPGVEALRAALGEADAVLFVTPEYNGSIPGQLKNAVDWASRPTVPEGALYGKPVAVVGASTGMFGAVWAQAELRKALGLAGARVLDRELPVPTADELIGEDGSIDEIEIVSELEAILEALVASAVENGELVRESRERVREHPLGI
jgi:chromate reductase